MVFLVILSLPFIIFVILILKIKKKKEKYYSMYQMIAANPTNETVDMLIDFHTKNKCIDEPNCWNRLRAVWFAINESPNVTTAKKEQVKKFLMLNGLTMHHKDTIIIDNYAK